MRFISFYRPGKEADTPPSRQKMDALGRLIDEMSQAGVLIATDGLQSSSKGARVQISGGMFSVSDGPFAETKELIAGYALIDAESKSEAVSWAKRFLSAMGEGECEVRQMDDGDPGHCIEKETSDKHPSVVAKR